jgi:hypothetical protein
LKNGTHVIANEVKQSHDLMKEIATSLRSSQRREGEFFKGLITVNYYRRINKHSAIFEFSLWTLVIKWAIMIKNTDTGDADLYSEDLQHS